jgi:hypothetical protein
MMKASSYEVDGNYLILVTLIPDAFGESVVDTANLVKAACGTDPVLNLVLKAAMPNLVSCELNDTHAAILLGEPAVVLSTPELSGTAGYDSFDLILSTDVDAYVFLCVYEDLGPDATLDYLDVLLCLDVNGTEVTTSAAAETEGGATMVLSVEGLSASTDYVVYAVAVAEDASPYWVTT